MAGVIVHPVDPPAAKVAWFSERICGKKRYPVSFISDEISAPHNVIHKGGKVLRYPGSGQSPGRAKPLIKSSGGNTAARTIAVIGNH